MTITSAPLYPEFFDTDESLHLVHDSMRARLAADYSPGDTSITVEGDPLTLTRWPTTGLITLTEQCSEIEDRAISFSYTDFDPTTGVFSGLELLPGFTDSVKLKRMTYVTQNVMDSHHNSLKDTIIAIQEFVGVEGAVDDLPFGDTMEGRTNFLRRVALAPKAWFTADKRTGLAPLEVEFKDLSFRLATDGTVGPVTITWEFGDNTASLVSTVSATSVVPEDSEDFYVYDSDGGIIKKTYLQPGIYDVTVRVENEFGSDECTFQDFIKVRSPAPNEAIIRFVDSQGQLTTPGTPSNGPFEIPPMIRSPINTLIGMEILSGENPATPGYTYAGEALGNDDTPIDPISSYTWALGDDLTHPNAPDTTASYGVGGIYDLKLRVDTEFGAYRITTYEDAIDIVENYNLWYIAFQDSENIRAYEYGLISETFKLNSSSSYPVTRDSSFLNGEPQAAKQIAEFEHNVSFSPVGTTSSGAGGSVLLSWASGRAASDARSLEEIKMVEYNGFTDTFLTRSSLNRPWNWANLSASSTSYYAFGAPATDPEPDTSPTNTQRMSLDLATMTATTVTMTVDDFFNGAGDLLQNPSIFDEDGDSQYGHFSVYRTTWRDGVGYIARNDGVGPFFRIKSFYRTEGSSSSPFQRVRKLTEIGGPTKLEGGLAPLSLGVYFFNNSGSISMFDVAAGVWRLGGPGVNSVAYRSIQDTTVAGFDSAANRLQVATDGDRRAYITFDYSPNAFLKFSEVDTTFSTLGSRPSADQFIIGIF
jgi:PKD repeat protein